MANGIDPSIQEAIIQQESSGRPEVVGDIGAAAGASTGLMQIQADTAKGLYKRGLLPEKWNDKKVKRKDLPELLKDPEFNKQAGSALFVDNKRILSKEAAELGIQLTPEQLNDLAIKAHNQGVSKTLKRELRGEEKPLPKVDEYLKKIKAKIKPAFQDGGRVFDPLTVDQSGPIASLSAMPEGFRDEEEEDKEGLTSSDKNILKDIEADPVEKQTFKQAKQDPTPEVQTAYQQVMSEYKAAKQTNDKARKLQAMLKVTDALGRYGAQTAAAQAQIAGGFQVKAPEYRTTAPTFEQLGGVRDPLGGALKRTELMARFQKLKGPGKGKPGKFQEIPVNGVMHKVLVDPVSGQTIQDYGVVPEKGKVSKYSIDPDDAASTRARENLKRMYPEVANKVLDTMSESDVNRWGSQLVNRTPTQFKIDQATEQKRGAQTRADLAKAKLAEIDARFQVKTRLKDEKAVRDVSEKLAGITGARSVYAKALLRETLSNDGLRVIESIRENKFAPSEQIAEELATVMASTLQGGNQATREAIRGLIPHTVVGDARSIKQYLTGTPQAYLNEDFLDHFEEQLKGQRDYWKENLSGAQRKMYLALKPVFVRKDKDGTLINQDLRDNFIETLNNPQAVKEERLRSPAPYGDIVERNGKQYKWNATKGKYQLVR